MGRFVPVNKSLIDYARNEARKRDKRELNDCIYIYEIRDGFLHYDRTVSRYGLGPMRAKQRVKEIEDRGREAFYTIGTLARMNAFY